MAGLAGWLVLYMYSVLERNVKENSALALSPPTGRRSLARLSALVIRPYAFTKSS
jgi:hypothetical protein